MYSFPNYLIIGTMKGGTTALQDFICMHPDVVKPTQKEIHYFSLRPQDSVEWYLSHFPCLENKLVGEASPTYFDVAYTQSIPKLIKKHNDNIKLILIVRDPVERAVSHFYHIRNVNKVKSIIDIDINDFFCLPVEEMLSQCTEIGFYLNQIINFSLYARKLQTYLSVFEPSQLLIIDSESLRNNAKETMGSVYSHLGLDDFYSDEFEVIKYSSGKDSSDLDQKTFDYLNTIFSRDWAVFRKIAGLS